MLQCPKCHQRVPDDAAFCGHCGQMLNDATSGHTANRHVVVLGVTAGLLAVVVAVLVMLILVRNQTQTSTPAQAATPASSSTPVTENAAQDQAAIPGKQEDPEQAEGQQQDRDIRSAQDELEERIQTAYAQNPTTIAVGETSAITGTVRGEYTDIGAEKVVMGWKYWLELPKPVTVISSTGRQTRDPTIDLGVSYNGTTRGEDWQDYLDKTITLQSTWTGAVQGSTSNAIALPKDSQILQIFE